MSEPRHQGKCGITGPYYPVGDVDWECRFHGVVAELRDPSRWGALNLRREDFYCPVGQPHLAPANRDGADDEEHRGMPKPWETMDKTEPFDEMPVAAQNEELLAAVGLLIEHIGVARRNPGASYPLMPQVIEEMGRRYGPWAR